MDLPRPEPDEPEDALLERVQCALLDEYWADLHRQTGPASRDWLHDRNCSDQAIARDLDVLDLLHQLQASSRASDHGSRRQTDWAAESFDWASDSRPAELVRQGGHDPEAAHGLAASGLDASAQEQRCGAPASPPSEKQQEAGGAPMRRIGKYVVIELLDAGGQAQVFRVVHPELAKELVLKLGRRPVVVGIESQADIAGRDRLRREAQLLAQCDHPNLVRVVDLDVCQDRPFVVMEHVHGLTLEQFVEQCRPDVRRAARLVAELARAVGYLHARGIIHQDIKPRNVLVDDQGRPRLIDFGLARLQQAWTEDTSRWTGGTAAYMSPEQARNRTDQIAPWTDIFGLGGILYHLLTCRPLYQGASRASVVLQAMKAEYVPVRQVNRRAPRALEKICHKALAAEPLGRHATAAELDRALRRFLGRRWVATAGLVALAMIGVAVALILPRATVPRVERSSILAPAVVPSRIVAFEVRHFQNDPFEEVGTIGLVSKATHENDDVRVSARFDAPAYTYLISLEPNGEVRLCHPPKETEPPARSAEIRYPLGPSTYFPLTDGPGLQAFVLVASRQPLQPYGKWQGRDGLKQRWKPVTADGVWSYDGHWIERVSSLPRGQPRKRSDEPRPFQEICEYLANLPGVDAIRALAFPVRPKK